ncbi:MAG: hypothetical protein AAGI91_00895 [Bacteroidota bacterium]
MAFILDHIVTTIIVTTLFFSMVATQFRVQETGMAQVSSHAAKSKALSLGQWVDQDIVALGENIVDNSARFGNPMPDSFAVQFIDEFGAKQTRTMTYTKEWRFFSDRFVGAAKQRQATRYLVVVQPDSIEVELSDGSTYTRPAFQLVRTQSIWKAVDPVTDLVGFTLADFTEDGRSVSTLSQFRIQLLDNDGNLFADSDPVAPDQASYVRVDFSMVPEFELRQNYLRELYWTTTLKVRPFWG